MPYKDKSKQAIAAAKHYRDNHHIYKARAVAHTNRIRDVIRAWLLSYLLIHPCIDCGEPDPIVLEFDHRSRADKRFAVKDFGNFSLPVVQTEVNKCDIRCANCHRRKTHRERAAEGGTLGVARDMTLPLFDCR